MAGRVLHDPRCEPVASVDSTPMSTDVASARRDWEDGYRRFRAAETDPSEAEKLHRQAEVVTRELRRRVGGVFTLEELATAYIDADAWAQDAVSEHAPQPGWPRTVSVAADAAFHVYATRRGRLRAVSEIDTSRPRRRPPKRSPWPRILGALAVGLVAFVLGIALGKALEDGPEPAVTQTFVRTLEPLPQEPAG